MLLMFLGVLAGGPILENATITKFFDRSRSDFRERETMKELLDVLVHRFDVLIALDADDEQNPALENIRSGYGAYNLTIRDISSGCNLNFLPDSILSESSLSDFLFVGGNAEGFLNFRRYRGFITEISAWKPFLKEEAMGSVVCYGWLLTVHADSETGRMLAASFGRSGDQLFPLANDLPLVNVNTVDTALLAPLLSCRSWQIPGVSAKAAALKSRLEQGPVNEGELRTLLGLGESHEIFRYLGVRTTFWGLSFKNGHYRMDAVIAAVPERGSKTIDHYILIEGKLSRAV
jgi:hypothetical protein